MEFNVLFAIGIMILGLFFVIIGVVVVGKLVGV
jgi:hypothetical protein